MVASNKTTVANVPQKYNQAFLSRRSRALSRDFVRCFHHFIDQFLEVLQAGGGNDDRISFAATLLGNAQETSTGIFFQRQVKRLAFNLNLIGFKRVFLNRLTRLLLRMLLVTLLPIRLPGEWRPYFV